VGENRLVPATYDLLGTTLREGLARLAAEGPPAGGSAAGVAAAVCAALVAMTARASTESWEEATGIAVQADVLRERLVVLAQSDAEVYGRALETLAHPEELPADRRDHELGAALAQAAETPLAIAAAAADVALLAAEAADRGDPRAQADAQVALLLSAAAARAAARLVEVNLGAREEDARVQEARAAAAVAARASRDVFPPV
jgi:methenyltetrahydrofolate cyclohydrolase